MNKSLSSNAEASECSLKDSKDLKKEEPEATGPKKNDTEKLENLAEKRKSIIKTFKVLDSKWKKMENLAVEMKLSKLILEEELPRQVAKCCNLDKEYKKCATQMENVLKVHDKMNKNEKKFEEFKTKNIVWDFIINKHRETMIQYMKQSKREENAPRRSKAMMREEQANAENQRKIKEGKKEKLELDGKRSIAGPSFK